MTENKWISLAVQTDFLKTNWLPMLTRNGRDWSFLNRVVSYLI